jgi:hypothetical protein
VVNRARTATLYASRCTRRPEAGHLHEICRAAGAMSGWSPPVAPTTVGEGL